MAQAVRGARRRWVFLVIGGIVVLLIILSALSGFFVDILWFREVHFSGVFWSVFWSKLVLGVIFGLLFFGLLLANLLVARRLTPKFRLPASWKIARSRSLSRREPRRSWSVASAWSIWTSICKGCSRKSCPSRLTAAS